MTLETIRLATQRAVLGSGYPYKVRTIHRHADDRGWLLAFADVLARHGRGIFECAPRFDGDGPAEPRVESELAWMEAMSIRSRRPLTFNLTNSADQGEHWRHAVALARAANGRGAQIRPQTTPRFIGVLTGIAHRTPFDHRPAWLALAPLSLDERLARLRDPVQRAALIEDADRALYRSKAAGKNRVTHSEAPQEASGPPGPPTLHAR